MAELWANLMAGRNHGIDDFLFKDRPQGTIENLLLGQLVSTYAQLNHRPSGKFGVILASTKGMSNDFVWNEGAAEARDPLTPLLEGFLKSSGLKPQRSLCVSNACSSTLAAFALAQLWLDQGLDEVLVLAADAVTPFVNRGFDSLKLLTSTGLQPFSADRSGFRLGDGVACFVLVKGTVTPNALRVRRIGLDSEGSAVTRPSHSGESLLLAAHRVPGLRETVPDLVIAHGTGTRINDETEDLTFTQLFADLPSAPLITGTKWCVGHTLAVSGAIDLIAACEALRRQEVFTLATTERIDPSFKSHYLTGAARKMKLSRVLVSSLGFGGMHAMAMVELPS